MTSVVLTEQVTQCLERWFVDTADHFFACCCFFFLFLSRIKFSERKIRGDSYLKRSGMLVERVQIKDSGLT